MITGRRCREYEKYVRAVFSARQLCICVPQVMIYAFDSIVDLNLVITEVSFLLLVHSWRWGFPRFIFTLDPTIYEEVFPVSGNAKFSEFFLVARGSDLSMCCVAVRVVSMNVRDRPFQLPQMAGLPTTCHLPLSRAYITNDGKWACIIK